MPAITTTDIEADLTQIAERIDQLMMWTRRQMTSSMSSATAGTLDSLLHFGPLRISDLAERERISQPGMTTIVNRLEKARLAERFRDPDDGRATLVRITDDGRQRLVERHTERSAVLLPYLRALDETHQTALAGALDALAELVRSETSTGSDVPTRKRS